MVKSLLFASVVGALVTGAVAQDAGQYGQCGGTGWTGPTTCPSGWVCTAVAAPWYYQCLQGTATSSSSSSSTRPTTTSTGGTTTRPSTTTSSSTSSAATAGGTLISGNSFIRGVESPYFHYYLQSEVVGTASDAVLGSPSTAAQFQIVSGQLIQNPQGTKLYAQVAAYNSGDKKLKVTWSTTPGTFGSFTWSGDTVEWSAASVSRPQNNAWLICADEAGHNDVYINLGPYSYQTPAGCADQTIHGYTGSTATA
ncbi:hypothetical protein CPB86DRAFT_128148 [Serendipita vermifera]|nr:hypothetical protein CPB86DRAFT_128148 [Serendipita vermifera]